MFVILTTQRSGSHLLSSLLNSHPDLTCYGEIVNNEIKPIEEMEEGEGVIYHYNQFFNLSKARKEIVRSSKILHLIRNDMDKLVRSRLVSGKYKDKLGAKSHYRRKETIHYPEFTDEEVERAKRCILKERKNALLELWDTEMFTLSYEMLTGDKSIKKLTNKPILRFLGVAPMTLETTLTKPNYKLT